MARYRWKEDLKENRRQAIRFLTREVGIGRRTIEDVVEEIKQAMAPVRRRQRGFKKAMATPTQRRRAIELVREAARLEKKGQGKRGRNATMRQRRRACQKELFQLIRRYNFNRPARRSLLVSRLLYGFSRLPEVNLRGRQLKIHALHGLAIILYCDGLLRVSEARVRHALPAYKTVTQRIQRFVASETRRGRGQRVLKQIAFATNLRQQLWREFSNAS